MGYKTEGDRDGSVCDTTEQLGGQRDQVAVRLRWEGSRCHEGTIAERKRAGGERKSRIRIIRYWGI